MLELSNDPYEGARYIKKLMLFSAFSNYGFNSLLLVSFLIFANGTA